MRTDRARTDRAARLAAGIVAVPVAIALAGWLFERAGRRRDARRYPDHGLLLSRDGQRIHIRQQGTGRPAVVLEAGLAASSLSWALVQPLVEEFTAVTSYDRRGLGWSASSRIRADLTAWLGDLQGVIEWVGGGQGVVLVGHSFGALLAIAFAQRNPERLAGLVLVDPVSIATWSQCPLQDKRRLQIGAALSRRGAWLAEFGIVRAALVLLLHGGQRVSRSIGRRAAGRGRATLERITSEVSKLPRELWPEIAACWSRPESFRAMAETLEALPECAAAVGSPALNPDLPVAILSAASATPAELDERNRWLAPLVKAQHTVLPQTGHWLHLDRPAEVAAAVRWCVESAATAGGFARLSAERAQDDATKRCADERSEERDRRVFPV